VFAGFTIDRVLGAGGMGTVYLAQHPRLPRKDALKLLRSDLSSDPGFRTRFEREADLAARLDHRNIVTVYDRGRTDEQLWIDMQYVDGIDASQALESDPDSMTVPRVLRIIAEVGNGLDFAHRHGLWHRDVKPANILLSPSAEDDEPERVLLTDFAWPRPSTRRASSPARATCWPPSPTPLRSRSSRGRWTTGSTSTRWAACSSSC